MPPKDGAGIEMKVGRLCGDVDGLREAYVGFRDTATVRINNHSDRIGSLERRQSVVSGVSAAIGSSAVSSFAPVLWQLVSGASVAAGGAARAEGRGRGCEAARCAG